MTRILAIALTASGVVFSASSSKAADLFERETGVNVFNNQFQPHQSYWHPEAWARYNHGPAISKTLRYAPNEVATPAPAYDYDWQRQSAPRPPSVAPKQFSFPQQGYYPREGEVLKAPGYEYDFGGAGTFPPTHPMEGAAWRGPRQRVVISSLAPTHSASGDIGRDSYADCPL